jgi:hypothetical protein
VARWLDVTGASHHLGLTENAIRGLIKRRQLLFGGMTEVGVLGDLWELD